MGADGFIVDPTAGYSFEVRCYRCSRPVVPNDPPINYHHECIGPDGRLAVSIEIENYEER